MRLLLPLALLAALPCCQTETIIRKVHPDGSLRCEGRMVDGLQEGPWTYFAAAGRKESQGAYHRDVQVGPWTWWHGNGNRSAQGTFADEHRIGLWRWWNPSGSPQMRGWFDRGQKNGDWAVFDRDGAPLESGEYADDRRVSRWTFRYPDGKPKAEGFFHKDAMVGTWTFHDASGKRSEKRYPMPPGTELVRERWQDGSLRRAGFLVDGQRHGRFVTWHENGARRASGDFEKGRPVGTWRAYDQKGELVADLVVTSGDFGVWIDGVREKRTGDIGARPPVTFGGVWTTSEELAALDARSRVERCFAEATSPSDAASFVIDAELASPPPAPDAAAALEKQSPPPVVPQRLTQREESNMWRWIKMYGERVTGEGFAMYRVPRSAASESEARARTMVGQRLPVTRFPTADGKETDILAGRAQRFTLLVVLRGFAGQVCPYCPAQLKALAPFRKALAELGTDVDALYPGPHGCTDAFCSAYERTFQGQNVPYRLLYDPGSRLPRALGILDHTTRSPILSLPTVVIVDGEGVIRWAYVGKHPADRPAARELIERIRKLRR